MFNETVDKFNEKVEEGKAYIFSNGKVERATKLDKYYY